MEITSFLNPSDFRQIDNIYWNYHAKSFGIPNLRDTITNACVKDDDKVIAFGMVKLYPEAILIMNYGASSRKKGEALKLLMGKAIRETREANHEFLHATIHDDAYFNLLAKHYGFAKSEGQQVFLEL